MTNNRIARARALVKTGAVKVARRKEGKQRAWTMPSTSHLGSWYEVFMSADYRPTGNSTRVVRASFWCNRRWAVGAGQEPGMARCDGNQRTVCYHCLAALVKLARAKRKVVQFVDSAEKAHKLARLGVVIELVGEGQVAPKVWAILKKKGKRRK